MPHFYTFILFLIRQITGPYFYLCREKSFLDR